MNHCSIQHSCFASGEEMRRTIVVCPRPRRLNVIDTNTTVVEPHFMRSHRWNLRNQQEICAAKAGNELLEINMPKVGRGADELVTQTASSPPFYSGSPPGRVSNPLTQDSRFGHKNFPPFSPPLGIAKPSPSSTCLGTSFASSPAVRIEGFDCLNSERRNLSVPALA